MKGSDEFGEFYNQIDVKLPETFSQEKIPMDKEDVPTAERVKKWKYLEKALRTLPGVKDIPLGLLIGNNCPETKRSYCQSR